MFNRQLHKILTISYYPITFSGDQPSILNRWLVSSVPRSQCNVTSTAPSVQPDSRLILRTELTTLSGNELEQNWRYYHSESQDTFYQSASPETMFGKDEDIYIYALCGVYCRKAEETFIYANSITPARIWINGQLVFSSSYNHHIRPHSFVYPFHKGINTILIEKAVFKEHKSLNLPQAGFMITTKPCRYLRNRRLNYFFGEEYFADLKHSFTLAPDRALYEAGRPIQLIVFPNWFTASPEPIYNYPQKVSFLSKLLRIILNFSSAKIRIEVYNAKDELIKSFQGQTSTYITLNLEPDTKGLLDIRVRHRYSTRKTSNTYVFVGDLPAERESLFLQAKERSDYNPEIISSIRHLTDIPNFQTGCLKGYPELMYHRMYHLIFEKYREFIRYLDSAPRQGPVQYFQVFANKALYFQPSELDNGFIAYGIYLPQNYSPRRKYPLLISVQFGQGIGQFPLTSQRYIEKGLFTEAIILNICGRGDLNNDFINEIGVLKVIRKVVAEFAIERERIYLVGTCMGTLKGFNIALRFPDLLAAVAGINGTFRMDILNPDFEYLQNIRNIQVYQLSGVEDFRFNYARVMSPLQYLEKSRTWRFLNYSHDDFDEILNSAKLMRALIRERKEKYPRTIQFTLCEPAYNKSYWLKIQHIEDLSAKAFINAQIISRSFIAIETKNIQSFELLFSPKLMRLNRMINLEVGGNSKSVSLFEYSKVLIARREQDWEVVVIPISARDFQEDYDYIGADSNRLGIKELYTRKCVILKPISFAVDQKAFYTKLYYLLQNPLRERMRLYRFNTCFENEISPGELSGTNIVMVIDGNKEPGVIQKQLLADAGIKIGINGISFRQHQFSDDLFCLVKCRNPYNNDYLGLIVYIRGNTVNEELIGLLNSFDNNPLFFHDAVFYCNNRYLTFRDTAAVNQNEAEAACSLEEIIV